MHNGWNEKTGLTDHTALQKYVASLTPAELVFVRKDAREAAEAQPDGRKAGYYADLVSYCSVALLRSRVRHRAH